MLKNIDDEYIDAVSRGVEVDPSLLQHADDAHLEAVSREQPAAVTLLRPSRLREDIVSLLRGCGRSAASLQFIKAKPEVKTTRRNPLSGWPQEAELHRLVADHERPRAPAA